MGVYDHESKKKRSPAVRKTFQREQQKFDTTTIFTESFRDAIELALNEGGAIRLGLTRDGGALAVGIYGLGNEPSTEYLRPSDDLEQFWHDLYESFKGSSDL